MARNFTDLEAKMRPESLVRAKARAKEMIPRPAWFFVGHWLLLAFAAVSRGDDALRLQPSAAEIGKYQRIDFDLDVPRGYRNPFDPQEVDVSLEIRAPGGEILVLPAFWLQPYRREILERGGRKDWLYPNGAALWRARFAPSAVGRYEAVARLKDAERDVRSPAVSFQCVESACPGFLQASTKDPRFLALADGRPLLAIGQNLAFIGPGQPVTLAKAEEIFGKLSASGANFLRIWTCGEDWAMAIEARKSVWGRSWGWKPPFAPAPDSGDSTGRPCVQLDGRHAAQAAMSPPNPLAVRPATRYVLSGKLRTDAADTAVRLTAGSLDLGQPLRAERTDAWSRFECNFETGRDQRFIDQITVRLEGGGTAWLDEWSLREAAGGAELLWEAAIRDPVRGFYNPTDCFILDQLVAAAEREGIYLQLCLITRDLYMSSLKDARSGETAQAIRDAKNLLRYAVARWGYSTHVAAWEYFNEIDPGLPTDRFYDELGEYLEQIDVYRHLRTTSTWGPSPKDWKHPRLDLAQTHHYIRPADKEQGHDEVAVVLKHVGRVREHAPNRPVLLAEFGLAEDNWQRSGFMKQDANLVHFHNALWASALSGAAGTAMFWWWEVLDPLDAYAHYKPLADFTADVPLDSGLEASEARATGGAIRVVGLQGRRDAYLWLFHEQATWWNQVVRNQTPATIASARLEVPQLTPGAYRVVWWDTARGRIRAERQVTVESGNLTLDVPSFERDIACKILPLRD